MKRFNLRKMLNFVSNIFLRKNIFKTGSINFLRIIYEKIK
jgi:hypothetical protein